MDGAVGKLSSVVFVITHSRCLTNMDFTERQSVYSTCGTEMIH